MPELPEVQALADFLRGRAIGLAIARVDVGAIHVLKTYDPPPSALAGSPVTGVQRNPAKKVGKQIDATRRLVKLAEATQPRHYRQLAPGQGRVVGGLAYGRAGGQQRPAGALLHQAADLREVGQRVAPQPQLGQRLPEAGPGPAVQQRLLAVKQHLPDHA